MADYSVKITITNNSNQKEINCQTTVGEETAKKVWEAGSSLIGIRPIIGMEDIR